MGRLGRKQRAWTTEEDSSLVEMYPTHTRKDIATFLGRTMGGVRWRCSFLRLADKVRPWTVEELALLHRYYSNGTGRVHLGRIAKRLGRLKSNVCRKARSLGLTKTDRFHDTQLALVFRRSDDGRTEVHSKWACSIRKRLRDHGHPRGMLGKHHSLETRAVIGSKSSAYMASLTDAQMRERTQKSMMTKMQLYGSTSAFRPHGSWKAGWRVIGGVRKYFRSRWEANYARYLEWLRKQGEILKWEHEPEVFWFDGIKRGCVSYLPDFRVTENDGSLTYYEVKGWMDDRSSTKLRRMAKYHPTIRLIVIGPDWFKSNRKMFGALLPDWEVGK